MKVSSIFAILALCLTLPLEYMDPILLFAPYAILAFRVFRSPVVYGLIWAPS